MIGKIKPVVVSAEESASIQKQLGIQEAQKAAPKSEDPVNYPVWDVLVNKKALIYVPNHTYVDNMGVTQLRMDKPLIHAVTDGKKFYNYRCVSGIVAESAGLTGECPLCDGCSEPWDLANLLIEEKCKSANLDPEDIDNPTVKSIRSNAFNDRVVKDANRYYTFPIVVFETVNDDGKTFIKDENGGYKYKVFWYNISESQYNDKWKKTLDGMEDEPTHPGGHFFLLNYCYTPSKGEPNKRDSARNMVVSPRKVKDSEAMCRRLDELTESWTPELAQQMVINNHIYSVNDLTRVTDEALENTRNLIALYKSKKLGVASADGGFGKLEEKVPEVPTGTVSGIPLDDSDIDVE